MTFEKKTVTAKDAPKGRGPFPQALRCGPMVFLSGQGPLSPATNAPIKGTFAEQARQTLRNVQAVLAAADLGLHDIVKATIYLQESSRIEEFNEIYREIMPEPWPARTLICAGLRGIEVEIDVIAMDRTAAELS
ncbi:MAG: Rid family hydrolase [Pseudolabrys sp.]|nr:Rid family hydrolase [Pseudolabrys sp.]MDP2298999.1 Rid family hydrolase [Pseudolabrys sp.]